MATTPAADRLAAGWHAPRPPRRPAGLPRCSCWASRATSPLMPWTAASTPWSSGCTIQGGGARLAGRLALHRAAPVPAPILRRPPPPSCCLLAGLLEGSLAGSLTGSLGGWLHLAAMRSASPATSPNSALTPPPPPLPPQLLPRPWRGHQLAALRAHVCGGHGWLPVVDRPPAGPVCGGPNDPAHGHIHPGKPGRWGRGGQGRWGRAGRARGMGRGIEGRGVEGRGRARARSRGRGRGVLARAASCGAAWKGRALWAQVGSL